MAEEPPVLVSTEDFRKDMERYIDVAGQGQGPIAVTRDSEIIG